MVSDKKLHVDVSALIINITGHFLYFMDFNLKIYSVIILLLTDKQIFANKIGA